MHLEMHACKWENGAMTEKGVIYCVPNGSNRGILKIDTNIEDVRELDFNLLPEHCKRESCVMLIVS